MTVTKKKLVQVISQELRLHPNDVRNVIQSFLDRLTDYLSNGDRLEFRDFGIFETVERKQKVGRNPKKAAVAIVIPARIAVKFTPGKKMKIMVEKKVGDGKQKVAGHPKKAAVMPAHMRTQFNPSKNEEKD